MKTTILFFTLLVLSSLSFAQSAADEKAVRAVIQKMEDAWNADDFTYAGTYDIFHQDATLINPVGMYWKNRADIIKAQQIFGKMMLQYESVKYLQTDIRFLAPTVASAIIKAQYKVEQDFNLPDGKKGGAKGDAHASMKQVLLTKNGNTWKIASLQVTDQSPSAQQFDPVKSQALR